MKEITHIEVFRSHWTGRSKKSLKPGEEHHARSYVSILAGGDKSILPKVLTDERIRKTKYPQTFNEYIRKLVKHVGKVAGKHFDGENPVPLIQAQIVYSREGPIIKNLHFLKGLSQDFKEFAKDEIKAGTQALTPEKVQQMNDLIFCYAA